MTVFRTKVLSTAVLAFAIVASAASSSSSKMDHHDDIYNAKFTSSPRLREDILSTIDRCESDLSCAGISFEPNGTVSHTGKLYHHSFVGQYKTSKTYVTNKKSFTYHRGKIIDGTVWTTEENVKLADAKKRCEERKECVAFTYPVRSLVNLNALSNVTYFSTLEKFVPDDMDRWRTYVSNDLSRASNVNAETLVYDEDVVERPYRSCCDTEEVPPMEEVIKADSLERISCDISREEFFLRYEVPRRPVMLVGCGKDWPAVRENKWSARNLAPRFSNSSRWRARIGGTTKLKSEDYNHRVAWGDISEAMLTGKPYYLFDQLYDPEAASIDDDYSDPRPVAGGDLYATLPHFAGPLRWFCHGPPNTGTSSHMDPFGTDAWNTLVKGHKAWVLYPRGFTDNGQLECEPTCSVKVPLTSHWYGSVGVNAARTEFPLDKYARHVLQRPGETIYVPDGLLHSVYNYDSTIAITKNYASAANLDNVWMETVIDGDPLKWRNMYYHTLNREQRRRVRGGKYWPPGRWERREEPCQSALEDDMAVFPMFELEEEYAFKEGELVEAMFGGGSFDEDEPDEWNVGRIVSIRNSLFTVEYSDGESDSNLSFEHVRRLPMVGDVVEARYRGENEWYKATVAAVRFDGTFAVLYDDGESDMNLPRKDVRRYVPPRDDEIVKVLWEKEDRDEEEEEQWIESIIDGERNSDGTYNVRHFDGEEVEEVPPKSVMRFRREFEAGDDVAVEMESADGGEVAWYRGTVSRARRNGRYDVTLLDGGGDNDGEDDEHDDEEGGGGAADCVSWRVLRPLWASDGVLGADEDNDDEDEEEEYDED